MLPNKSTNLPRKSRKKLKLEKADAAGKLLARKEGTSVGVDASFLLSPSRTLHNLHNLLVHTLHNMHNWHIRWYAGCSLATFWPGKVDRFFNYVHAIPLLILSYRRVGVNDPLILYFKAVSYA